MRLDLNFDQKKTGAKGVKGNTVFCYSLASKKHKSVTMDKVRFAGDLSQEEAPNILDAFPVEEPSLDDELLEEAIPPSASTSCKQRVAKATPVPALSPTTGAKQSRDTSVSRLQQLQHRQNYDTIHRYNLRNR